MYARRAEYVGKIKGLRRYECLIVDLPDGLHLGMISRVLKFINHDPASAKTWAP